MKKYPTIEMKVVFSFFANYHHKRSFTDIGCLMNTHIYRLSRQTHTHIYQHINKCMDAATNVLVGLVCQCMMLIDDHYHHHNHCNVIIISVVLWLKILFYSHNE